ncbi:MAG: cation:proton antiporter [Candidatus Hydrothermarchaeales archaeon]
MNELLAIAIVLAGAKIAGEIAKRAHQPSIIGEIVTGIILGGSMLNILEMDTALNLLSELGIILLLFLAGISIDVDRLKSVGSVVLVGSLFDIVFAFLLGYFIGLLFGFSQMTALFLGGILTATSVGITTRTLMDIGKLDTKAGMTILGVAVLDDIQGIFVLSILAGMATTGTTPPLSEFVILILMVVGFFAILLTIGPGIMGFMETVVNSMRIDEAPFALTLVFLFSLAYVAEQIRLAHIVGAFAAGLVINMGTHYHEAIAEKFTPITYGFLAPFFFVGVGLKTDLSAILHTGFLITIGIVLAAFVGKISGSTLGCSIMGYDKKDSFRVGFGMIPRAEVCLITATIGLEAGIISPELFSSVVVMVLVCALSAPVLVKWAFKGEE